LLLYYITDRAQFPGTEHDRRERLLERIASAASCSIDFIQLREKDLPARELEILAQAAVEKVRASSTRTRLLINSRSDVALAAGAAGVHLRSNDISPADVRGIWRLAHKSAPVIAVSCHTEPEVVSAKKNGADFVVFGPVFDKKDASFPISPNIGEKLSTPANGLYQLRSVCRDGIPVLALGGVTLENAKLCVQAGAAGVAGIRLFQQGDLANTVKNLHALQQNLTP
jgi:thiamine-phosphate pyrophosphorylase